MSLKHPKIAGNIINLCTQYLSHNVSEEGFVSGISSYKQYFEDLKDKEWKVFNKDKPEIPRVDGYALTRLLREGEDDWTFDQDLIDYCLEEDEDDWSEFLGWSVEVECHGDHVNDSQVVDYTLTFVSPQGYKYVICNSHCLMQGWNFEGDLKFE